MSLLEKKFGRVNELFFEKLTQESEKINQEFSNLICSVYVYDDEQSARLSDYCVGLDIVLQWIFDDVADNLCFEIYLVEEDKKHLFNIVSSWGFPTNQEIERCFDDAVEVSEDILEIAQEKLPRMLEKLAEEITKYPKGR